MRHYVNQLDVCLARYDSIAAQWDQNHQWQMLSSQRFTECQDRYSFISKIRDTAIGAIERFEMETHPQQAAN
jgi:hypothetical protein